MKYSIILFLLCFFQITPVFGMQTIEAVINNDIVTSFDVDARTKLAMLAAEVPDNAETRRLFRVQTLQTLVNETLQRQEIERLKIVVTDDEIAAAMNELEQNNGLPRGGLPLLLQQKGIPIQTMHDKIRVSIAWGQLVRGRFGSQINVSDEEVNSIIARIEENQGKQENRVAEIRLTIPTPADAPRVERFANRIIEQLTSGGNFAAIAQQFSDSPTAAVGGDMGWILADDMEKAIADVILRMRPGQISKPIRVNDDFVVLLLRDRRVIGAVDDEEPTITLYQIVIPINAPNAARVADTAATSINTCAQAEAYAKQHNFREAGSLGTLRLSALPPDVSRHVEGLAVGKTAEPLLFRDAWRVLSVCARTMPELRLPDPELVRQRLRGQQFERHAQRYLRDLRQAAFVDIRTADAPAER